MQGTEKRLSVQQNMLMNTIGMMVYLVCQWLVGVLTVRLSGYADNGIYTLAVSLSNFFFVIATFNLRHFQVSDVENRHSLGRYISTRLVTMGLSLAALLVFLLLNRQYSLHQSACILLYVLYRFSEALGDTFAAAEQKNSRMDYICVSMCLRGLLSLAVFVAALTLTHSLPLALLGMAVVCFAVVLLYDLRIVRRMHSFTLSLTRENCLPLLRIAWVLMISSAMMTLLTAIPRYFLEYYHGSEVMGFYGAVATPAVVVQAGCSFIYTPLVAPMAELWHKGDVKAFRATLLKTLIAVSLLMAVIVVGAALLGRWGLQLIFGESILPYASLLIPVLFTTFFMALLYLFEVPLTIIRHQKSMMVCHIAAVVLALVLSVTLIPSMSMDGVNLIVCLCAGLDALVLGFMAFRAKKTDENH